MNLKPVGFDQADRFNGISVNQCTGKEGNSMDERVDSALKDITVIRETLDDTRVHYRGMYFMCFVMAAFNGVRYSWELVNLWVMPQMMVVSGYVLCYLWPFFLLISFLYIYRHEKKYSNKYYLGMLGIWGFMAGVLPAVAALVNVFSLFMESGRASVEAIQMRGSFFAESISSILLVSILLVICAYILQNRIFMILAILNLFCFMMLEECFASAGIPFPFKGQAQARLVYSSIYSMAVTCFGYLALGMYLLGKQAKWKERRDRFS